MVSTLTVRLARRSPTLDSPAALFPGVDGRTPVERLLTDRDWRLRTGSEAPDTGHLFPAVDAGDAPVVRFGPAVGSPRAKPWASSVGPCQGSLVRPTPL